MVWIWFEDGGGKMWNDIETTTDYWGSNDIRFVYLFVQTWGIVNDYTSEFQKTIIRCNIDFGL